MKVLGVIPARYHSRRFPGKPLADIEGKPMIRHVYERARKSSVLDRIIVATDDHRIAEAVNEFGGEVMLTTEEHNNGTERCAEVSRQVTGFDYIVNIQCDEPFFDPKVLESFHLLFEQHEGLGTLITRITNNTLISNPNEVKVVVDTQGRAIYFSRNPIPHSSGHDSIYYKHIGIYAYRTDILRKICKLPVTPLEQSEKLEQLRWLEHGLPIQTFPVEKDSQSINSPSDLSTIHPEK